MSEESVLGMLEGIITLQTTDMTPLSKAYNAGEKRKVIDVVFG